jgi:hypothetical protein
LRLCTNRNAKARNRFKRINVVVVVIVILVVAAVVVVVVVVEEKSRFSGSRCNTDYVIL